VSDIDETVEPAVDHHGAIRRNLRAVYQSTNDFNFVKTFKWGLIIALVVSIISVVSLLTNGLNLGIDFEGGSVWEVPSDGASVDDARAVMVELDAGSAKIQLVTNADGTEILRIQADITTDSESRAVTQALAEFGGVTTEDVSVTTVGPSWGEQITKQAQRALIYFFIAITLYISIRLEWKMAVGALVSMAHDLLLSVGVYSVFQIEVTPATVISFLTILGYSLYDTIVVFDRALENSARQVSRVPYRVIMNRTLNQTLMRSVNTTVATILPIISMLVVGAVLLGAETLEEFALALLIGLTSGAYSSLFVAAPIVSWLKEREPRWAYTGDGLVPADAVTGAAITPRAARRTASGSAVAPASGPTGAIPPRPRKAKKRK
jgi:preprotein translocase subunit SecF